LEAIAPSVLESPELNKLKPILAANKIESHEICNNICKVVEATRDQLSAANLVDSYAEKVKDSTLAAYDALDQLFVLKASRICKSEKNKKYITNLLNSFLSAPDPEKTKAIDADGFSSSKIYIDQFQVMAIKELMSRRLELGLNQTTLNRLKLKLEKSLENLSKTFSVLTGIGGSANNTYAQSCTLIAGCNSSLATNDPEFQKAMNEIETLTSENPISLTYDPRGKYNRKDNEQGSSARAIPANLVVYLKAKEKDSKKLSTENLIKALKNYSKNKDELLNHFLFFRNGSFNAHNEKRNYLASYYFPATIPYLMSALKILKQDPQLSETQKAEIDTLDKEFKNTLRDLIKIEPNKTTMAHQENFSTTNQLWQASPRYSNALLGIALLAGYGEECSDFFKIPRPPKEAPLWGILSGLDVFGIPKDDNQSKENPGHNN
jgi:hypothetical protein